MKLITLFSRKLHLCLLLFTTFLGLINYSSGQTEVKVNLPLAAVLVPNIGVEIQVGEKTSLQLDVLGSFWDSIDGEPLQLNQTFFEVRYYNKPDTRGWFVGSHIGYGMFTLNKPYKLIIYDFYSNGNTPDAVKGEYRSGRSTFYGLTVGYKKRFNSRWGLEAFLGAGYVMSWYKGYQGLERVDIKDKKYRDFNGTGEFVLYRGGLMLTYRIFD